MHRIEITGLTVADIHNLISSAVEEAMNMALERQKQPPLSEELTLEQAAAVLRCHKATVRRKMLAAGIAGYRFGKEITLKRSDLERIKKKHK